jgi:hypothetical protein
LLEPFPTVPAEQCRDAPQDTNVRGDEFRRYKVDYAADTEATAGKGIVSLSNSGLRNPGLCFHVLTNELSHELPHTAELKVKIKNIAD